MPDPTVNIPLLRKAVEWAEAEAAKPPELCEWRQAYWVTPAGRDPSEWGIWAESKTTSEVGKASECGTCYCIAGFTVATQVGPLRTSVGDRAAELLGLDESQADLLFSASNKIEDVRRIAESIAGERL